MSILSNTEIISAIKTVVDPEMHIDVYALGLIYDISSTESGVEILMTLTTPFCPYADMLVSSVKHAVQKLGVAVNVTVTFEPQWVPPEDIRIAMGV